jgi:branched-chain amino acid aminotransferase
MFECTGAYYSRDNSFFETASWHKDWFETGKCYYEVLRVMDGTCLFAEDHLLRLNESIRLSGLNFSIELSPVSAVIRELIRRNKLKSGNIRLALRVTDSNPPVLYACCVPFSYPDPIQYEQGVPTAVYRKVRSHPNIKRYYSGYQKQMHEFMQNRNIYEVLLLDEEDRITEGSKSNIFFIRENLVITAPGENVLKGITREKVLNLCNKLFYKVFEESISIDNLATMEAVFLTGTSPKILPVCRIDGRPFSVNHPLMRRLMEAYDRMILSEIEHSRSGR